MTMLAVKNFFLPERRAADTPRFSRMPEALMRSMRRRSLRAKRTKSLVVGQEKRKSDSFVNSQEWTMSRMVPDLRLGLVGSLCSGKSALVHRYLTGSYVQEESPEGGRFKKEVLVDGHSYLLLIRDEGGAPEAQFASWVDAVIFVFSLENEDSFNAVYAYYNKMAHLRNSTEIPLILVGTQDTISENNPRVIDDVKARKLATDLKRCSYYETCATYGLNVERVFQDACQQIVQQRLSSSTSCLTPGSSRPSTPLSLAAPPGAPAAAAPALRPQANISSLHSNSPSHNNHHSNQMNAYSKDPLMRGNHTLSASSNHIHRSNPSHNDLSSADAHSLSSANDHTRWGHALASHGSSQGLVTIATENNNIAKFTAPPCIDSLQLPSYKDSKDLPTPSSTPTTSRKTRRRSNLFTPSKKGEDKFKNEELGSGRAIPLKQGYLHKKSSKALNKEWKKKYVALCNDGRLTYHPSINDYMENVHGKEISLQYVTVKVPGQKPRGSRSVITTVPGGHQPQPLSLHTHSSALQDAIGGLSLSAYEVGRDGGGGRQEEVALPNGSSQHHTPHVTKRHRRIKSSGLKKDGDTEDQEVYEFCIVSLEGKRWRFEAGSLVERDAWVAAVERQILASLQGPGGAEAALSRHLRLVPGNSTCVDCDAPEPGWASLNLGVLMCIECSGVHRNLGSHISRVRSLELDEWPPGHLSVMLSIGNSLANSVWEADLRGNTKPGPTSPREHKERWIRKKYEGKCFLLPAVSADSECVVPVVGGGAGLLPLLQALARARPQDVNRPSGSCRRTPLLHACAQGDLPQAQLLIWNNANPNLLDADGMSCLQLARSAAAQLSSCPGAGGRGCLLGSCPQHEGAGPAGSCLCPLLALLAPPSAAHSLVQLLLSQQANTIANTLSHNGAFPAPNAKLNGNASCHQANIT